MTTRRIIELLDARYVFYPVQRLWAKANGGPNDKRARRESVQDFRV
jgi:hypothetical protein